MNRVIECIPNFSQGRDKAAIEYIIDAVRGVDGVKLLDYSSDSDHNRSVVTFIGTPEKIGDAMLEMARRVYEKIDMSTHKGAHPRMGALDVVPFVPVKGVTTEECIEIAKSVSKRIGEEFNVPVYLYEDAATKPERENLANVRKGQYEGFFQKIKNNEWKPDYGPQEMNVRSGCTAVGVRFPLIAYNINLGTDNIEIANTISKVIRNIGGGLRFVKAVGVKIEHRNIVQVSINITNYEKTALYRVFEMVKMEAKRYGVPVIGSEVIGLVPMAALIQCSEYYLQIENFSQEQILEKRVWE